LINYCERFDPGLALHDRLLYQNTFGHVQVSATPVSRCGRTQLKPEFRLRGWRNHNRAASRLRKSPCAASEFLVVAALLDAFTHRDG
jgi:hypothetical protein